MSTISTNDIRKLIALVNIDDIEYSNTDSLFDTGILDSLKTIQLMILLEKHLGVRIEPMELQIENFENIDLLVSYINTKGNNDE